MPSDGLVHYANVIRDPYMDNGQATAGGMVKANILLVRDRLIAGNISNRKPDVSKLHYYLPSLLFEPLNRV